MRLALRLSIASLTASVPKSTLDDRTLASDKAGHKEADIANTAIDLKQMHPAVDSGLSCRP
jgi:hypothetical protein